MKAVIKDFSGNPKNPVVVAEVILDVSTGEAKIVTDRVALREALARGVVGRGGIEYTPEQGEEYIQALPFHFSNAYRRAEIVE